MINKTVQEARRVTYLGKLEDDNRNPSTLGWQAFRFLEGGAPDHTAVGMSNARNPRALPALASNEKTNRSVW